MSILYRDTSTSTRTAEVFSYHLIFIFLGKYTFLPHSTVHTLFNGIARTMVFKLIDSITFSQSWII